MRIQRVDIIAGISVVLLLLWASFLLEPTTTGQPYNETVLVNTTVNITNAAPMVYNVVLPPTNNLIAYSNATIRCNFTVFDYDNNTAGANATLHFSTVSPLGLQDQNTLYRNSSCTRLSAPDYYSNYTCTFDVAYFANNGTWFCNATAIDSMNSFTRNASIGGVVNPLVAIKIPLILDYGQLSVNEISNDTLANITNVGNRDANITVKGYGLTEGDGYAMVCDSGNIAVNYERYDTYAETDYTFMYELTSSDYMMPSFWVPQRQHETLEFSNSTYWKIQIPSGAGGICKGKILFTAVDRRN